MKTLKLFIAIILTASLFTILKFYYTPFLVQVCINNECIIESHSESSIVLYCILFCLYFLTLLLLLNINKQLLTDYIKAILLISLILLPLLFFLQYSIVYDSSKFRLDKHIVNNIAVNYTLFYLVPTFLLFPLLFKQIITFINGKDSLYKLSFIGQPTTDYRLLRFIAMLLDSIVLILLTFLFSKVIVIYPNSFILIIVLYHLYHFTMEYSFNTSIGKTITGLKIENNNGNKITAFTILVRTISRTIPLAYLPIFFKKKGLHDYISGTIVVRNAPLL